jgi:hypothetical protein
MGIMRVRGGAAGLAGRRIAPEAGSSATREGVGGDPATASGVIRVRG